MSERYGPCTSCGRIKIENGKPVAYRIDDCLVCGGSGKSGDVRFLLQKWADEEYERDYFYNESHQPDWSIR